MDEGDVGDRHNATHEWLGAVERLCVGRRRLEDEVAVSLELHGRLCLVVVVVREGGRPERVVVGLQVGDFDGFAIGVAVPLPDVGHVVSRHVVEVGLRLDRVKRDEA